jgi:hypothetical protein
METPEPDLIHATGCKQTSLRKMDVREMGCEGKSRRK